MLRMVIGLVLVLTAAAPVQARSLGETQIVNEAALTKLKRNKGVRLQWVWGAQPGALKVTETPGGVRLIGGQGPHNGDALTVDGIVTRIDARTFQFKGRIIIVDDETTQPCVREGSYTFRITGSRKFWRMKEQIAGCAGRADLTDYVDILF